MKIFLLNSITQRTGLAGTLNSFGIQTTNNYNDPECTAYLTILEPDALSFDNIEDIQTYVEVYGGHTPSFLSSKIKPVNENLADKWLLHKALADNQLPSIPTILPTSLEEIQNFFNEHTSVFCKPRVGSASKHPVLHSIGLGIEINENYGEDIVNYIKTIPTPTSNVYYKKFTSYDDFIANVDIENFLEIQRNNKSLRIHQCILQRAMDFNFIKYYTGWVNGNGDIYIEPKSDSFQDSFIPDPINNRRMVTTEALYNIVNIPSFMSDYGRLTDSNDPNNIFTYLNNVFKINNIKNTPFSVQVIQCNNQLIIMDYTSRAEKMLSKAWSSNNLIVNRLNYMHDVAPNIIDDTNYMCYFVCPMPSGGINSNIKSLIEKYNIEINVPVRLHSSIVGLRAYGSNTYEIQNNIKEFLTELKNYEVNL
jgi:hypothetical protein